MQQPLELTHSSVVGDTKVLPSVRMTEEQFQDMIKTLRLTPLNAQHLPQLEEIKTNLIAISEQTSETPAFVPETTTTAPFSKFQAPINVQSVSTGLSQQSVPLPSTFTQFEKKYEPQPLRTPQANSELPSVSSNPENRRNFVPISDPQRASPYDFIATGRIHKANPDEVLKKSRSLIETVEGK